MCSPFPLLFLMKWKNMWFPLSLILLFSLQMLSSSTFSSKKMPLFCLLSPSVSLSHSLCAFNLSFSFDKVLLPVLLKAYISSLQIDPFLPCHHSAYTCLHFFTLIYYNFPPVIFPKRQSSSKFSPMMSLIKLSWCLSHFNSNNTEHC